MLNEIQSQLSAVGQDHLLAFWSRLNPAEQTRLQTQLAAIDFAEFANLRRQHLHPDLSHAAIPEIAWDSLQPPRAVRLNEEPPGFTRAQAHACGEEALKAGKIGMILVAGG